MVRHPYLHYPQEAAFRSMDSAQFMVGADFMVAPVLDPGVAVVSVTLPQGGWVDLWSGQAASAGGLKEVPHPWGVRLCSTARVPPPERNCVAA